MTLLGSSFVFSTFHRLVAVACVLLPMSVSPGSAAAASAEGDRPSFSWQVLDPGTTDGFVTLDAVSSEVAWAATDRGSVLLTVDGGVTFRDVAPSRFEEWYYGDLEARNAEKALLLDKRGILRTSNGGDSWRRTFRSPRFYRQVAMFDRLHGFAVPAQAYPNKFKIVVTDDGGRSWHKVDPSGIPRSPHAEGVYADVEIANATGGTGFFGTHHETSRVFRSRDFGVTWEASSTPIEGGVTSPDFRTNHFGLAAGVGVLGASELARTTDGGVTWASVEAIPAGDYYDLEWWSDRHGNERSEVPDNQKIVFLVGLSGSNVSRDRGKTWTHFDDTPLARVDCVERSKACWGAGTAGFLARLAIN
jgi:photosystem II stability/assembly factor-like uncharacterized protein